jgi:multimeric flavodoxin WrbA
MSVVGISGSPRHANTEIMVREALSAAETVPGVVTEFVSLANKKISGCINCRGCVKKGFCIIQDDWQECVKPLIDPVPDGVILGAAVYFFNLNSQARAYMERCTSLLKGLFFKEASQMPPDWSRTAGAGIAVGYDRNGGQEHTISSIIHWFLINNFVCVGGSHVGYIGAPGWLDGENNRDSVLRDTAIGLEACRIVGRRVAETARLLKAGHAALQSAEGNCPDPGDPQ